ncbi:MAG: peptidase S41, partial [Vicinamibacterales bacterium]
LPFMRGLPDRVPGKVYVLMSHYTFSAGIVSAAAVKKAGGEKVVIVGESPGDRLRFWSEGGNACLPGSGFCLHYTDGLFDLEHGCEGTPGCYGDQFDVEVGRLEPEIVAPLTAADYLAARDSAVETVLANLH